MDESKKATTQSRHPDLSAYHRNTHLGLEKCVIKLVEEGQQEQLARTSG